MTGPSVPADALGTALAELVGADEWVGSELGVRDGRGEPEWWGHPVGDAEGVGDGLAGAVLGGGVVAGAACTTSGGAGVGGAADVADGLGTGDGAAGEGVAGSAAGDGLDVLRSRWLPTCGVPRSSKLNAVLAVPGWT